MNEDILNYIEKALAYMLLKTIEEHKKIITEGGK